MNEYWHTNATNNWGEVELPLSRAEVSSNTVGRIIQLGRSGVPLSRTEYLRRIVGVGHVKFFYRGK